MIASLHGIVERMSASLVTLNVNGVGYEVRCSEGALRRLEEGQKTSLVIHTDVKEDSIRLFGFADELEKQVFLLLMRVNGVGAKTAADIISKIDKLELLRAIGAGDMQKLKGIRGVGKKIAERIVVELRDKVTEFVNENQSSQLVVEKQVETPYSDAIEALQALGFAQKDAERAVQDAVQNGIGAGADSAALVREALRYV